RDRRSVPYADRGLVLAHPKPLSVHGAGRRRNRPRCGVAADSAGMENAVGNSPALAGRTHRQNGLPAWLHAVRTHDPVAGLHARTARPADPLAGPQARAPRPAEGGPMIRFWLATFGVDPKGPASAAAPLAGASRLAIEI